MRVGDLIEFRVADVVKRGELVNVDPPIMRDAGVHAYVLLRGGEVEVVGRATHPTSAREEVIARITRYRDSLDERSTATGGESAHPTGHGAPPTE